MLLGAHLSIAGGLHHALEKAAHYGFDTVAVFVRNQRQWRAGPLKEQAAATFRRVRGQLKINPVVAHGSYLVNLAGEATVRDKSIAATADELDRCGRLGIEYLVIHPGACENAELGIRRIADGLNRVVAPSAKEQPANWVAQPRILLETTAGQGHAIGRTFEELRAILDLLQPPDRFGICLDTCHVFATGYDIRTPREYRRTMKALDQTVGLEKLMAIHLNDSVKGLGSHVDRHAHIGLGRIGKEAFGHFTNDRRLAKAPMVLETPKGLTEDGRDWDEVNAQAVRSLVR